MPIQKFDELGNQYTATKQFTVYVKDILGWATVTITCKDQAKVDEAVKALKKWAKNEKLVYGEDYKFGDIIDI